MKFGLHLDHYIMLTEILMRIHLQWHTEMSLNIHVDSVVSKHFKVDVALGRVGVATEGRTSQLGGSDGMLVENFELLDSIYS
jgi:hypothetical protein